MNRGTTTMTDEPTFAEGAEGEGADVLAYRARRQRAEELGLYRPDTEHDACGVGFVANIDGRRSHDIVAKGLQILDNLTHRGACGSDPLTGDGAGILLQIPHGFFHKECRRLGFELPRPGLYGAGMVFLPARERAACIALFEAIVREEGYVVLGWRDVPIYAGACGPLARAAMPAIRQVFVSCADEDCDPATLERKLYVIRKRVERSVRESELRDKDSFYVTSLSSRTIIYKGLLLPDQIPHFYLDLRDPAVETALAVVHQRFSTNTFPSWERAHPYRFLAHNGEINTLRGNINWMKAREAIFASERFGPDLAKLFPIIAPGGSDSAMFDNALELLVHTGRSLPHAIMMMVPEAWQNHATMSDNKKAFYEYHASLMEPWDGPASIAFSDGQVVGAVLDRNGLRPSRYVVTHDGLVVMASEVGVLDIPPENIKLKGRLRPGRMFLVDTVAKRIIGDEELKESIARQKPYRQWLSQGLVALEDLPAKEAVSSLSDPKTLLGKQKAFGYTLEDLRILMPPMALNGQEAIGSMGTDTPLAVLSDRPQLLFHYFKQLFAQVTNPPIDPIREDLVMSIVTSIGPDKNLFEATPGHCRQFKLRSPLLTNADLAKIRVLDQEDFRATTLPMLFPAREGGPGLERALEALCESASRAIVAGKTILVLSDRGVDAEHAPIPSLLAAAAVHHHLIRTGDRTRCAIILETGEPREVMHFSLLIGYGVSAINPYLAFECLADLVRAGILKNIDVATATKNYIKAVDKGLMKVISKMGVSTLQSYRGAQIFEAIGLSSQVINRYFTWTASQVEGAGLDVIAREAALRHASAYDAAFEAGETEETGGELDVGGQYQWRRRGEHHLFNPHTVAKLQDAVRRDSFATFKEYSQHINDQSVRLATLRGLLTFKARTAIAIDEVEPARQIVRRFKTGGMSFGSISKEAHETLAIAMNRIGGKSNSGEGGEDPERFLPLPNGDLRRSAIKQVASARFGVTIGYLVNGDELQIKIAQGAKPGEGGQLPGHKVDEMIARVRYSTPGVGLISPPPHHDIYSIEDIAQLIHDLKNANRRARVTVKLVAEIGVGTVAAGVCKAKADLVLISGHDGGTGASPLTSIKHAGAPWELGLAETQQVLVQNGLRGRIRVEADGQLKTGRDVAIAALLGAEEFGFATAPLVSLGCIMMRKCHLNTCPVGVATQDPELRKKFAGKPEHVINFMFFIAEELREIMAQLGLRTVDEMVGRVDLLETRPAIDHWKARGMDLSRILYKPEPPPGAAIRCVEKQDHGLDKALDNQLLDLAHDALEHKKPVEISLPIRNANRTVGTMLSSEIARRHGAEGLPADTIRLYFHGSAGQSFGAFLAHGVTMRLEGDANDYLGKGISGGRIIAYPPKKATFVPEDNVIVGNVALYGATGGEVFLRGQAGERFAVRNSGGVAVVEGVGAHGCEYMTKGLVVVLGDTGRNFAAGMSGGIAYVLDRGGDFAIRCNTSMVELVAVDSEKDESTLKHLVERHYEYTASEVAKRVLLDWKNWLPKFVKVLPTEYKQVLSRQHLDSETIRLAAV
jgi:glutamate synthase domain-containing protein 2/glutamate synthase domain-containing protein 1/glutamate synthase domain-containing protein 3